MTAKRSSVSHFGSHRLDRISVMMPIGRLM